MAPSRTWKTTDNAVLMAQPKKGCYMKTAIDYLCQVTEILNIARQDYSMCSKLISSLDREAQDILHLIETENFNASRGYLLARNLKKIRIKRREVKNNQALLQVLLAKFNGEFLQALDRKLINKARQQSKYKYVPKVTCNDAVHKGDTQLCPHQADVRS